MLYIFIESLPKIFKEKPSSYCCGQ